MDEALYSNQLEEEEAKNERSFHEIPAKRGELEEPEKIEQVSQTCYMPLKTDVSKPKRNHKEC